MDNIDKPLELTIEAVFQDDQYIIPLYQRNYAWEEKEINQLIQDIWDFASDDLESNYYIGSLVVHKRKLNDDIKVVYETIDGQQRLTTLNILLSVIKNEFGFDVPVKHYEKLKFDSRLLSTETLKRLYYGEVNNSGPKNPSMVQAYAIILKKLNEHSEIEINQFYYYLLNKVVILRVEVPKDTDLNHYFEIMNNRGEQLEKQEILKASLLAHLMYDEESSLAFSMIWDACSNMDKYMQLNFKKKYRDAVFLEGDEKTWDYLPENFEEFKQYILPVKNKEVNTKEKLEELNIISLLTGELKDNIQSYEDDDNEFENVTFNSIIGFPNFLLHVLRVYSQEDIRLDDKRLIKTFERYIDKQADKVQFVKDFASALLKCRFLFDKYIIKREFKHDTDSWSLQALRITKSRKQLKAYYTKSFESEIINKRILMLLSMFHVSFPQIIYKHWLSGVLNFLYNQSNLDIEGEVYACHLEKLSNAFLFDRFGKQEVEYYDIIFKNQCELINKAINEDLLHVGTNVQNFIFNRLDYLIWRSETLEKEKRFNIMNIESFEFAFRSSVEHYYPQNAKPGAVKILVGKNYIHQFGNLCLISRSKNSELSNYSPLAKAEHYEQSSTIESLKQRLMMRKRENWDEQSILEHQKEMIDLLIKKGELN
ncbi:DUF262 domain-containing protein [Pedobacter caeni]|uniref:Uncharacterized conserved protein, contains ParB-like and HNH nuclease domains n=1 Tax=Pedobacter caeni TaxID=288992 RepID=A0A1M4TP57_9SPHI|nr:DUF262 domain-containing protein [Pedobacter caeni]SHE46299.1 Uncharacterized conserved protein, contains ParB-like and HNH nuclease domains [Pedobacter caeni]